MFNETQTKVVCNWLLGGVQACEVSCQIWGIHTNGCRIT